MAICEPWKTKDDDKVSQYTDRQLAEFGDILSLNKILMMEFANRKRSSEDGTAISEYEAHILILIQQNPGITSISLAKKISRTKSTVSSLIFKLCTAGYIKKEVNPQNRREHCLTLTDLGNKLCESHHKQDAELMRISLREMLKYCTVEEFETYIRVTKIRNQIFSDEPVTGTAPEVWGC